MTAIEAGLHALGVAFLAVQDEPPAEEGPLAGLARALWIALRWKRLGAVDDDVAAGVLASVIELPETVELVSLRMLGWPMAELIHAGARLDLLSLEALAAARHLAAGICLAVQDDNEPLRVAASSFGVSIRLVSG